MKALVVDDSSTIRRIIREVLETRFGLEVEEAEDVGQALDLEGPFALVVTDLLMPGLNGLALIRRIRGRSGETRTPILVVSVEVEPETTRRALELGADAFLGKPFHLRDLTERVASLLPG
ncbi:MAG: response regulator [Deferrisomatales bacterium]